MLDVFAGISGYWRITRASSISLCGRGPAGATFLVFLVVQRTRAGVTTRVRGDRPAARVSGVAGARRRLDSAPGARRAAGAVSDGARVRVCGFPGERRSGLVAVGSCPAVRCGPVLRDWCKALRRSRHRVRLPPILSATARAAELRKQGCEIKMFKLVGQQGAGFGIKDPRVIITRVEFRRHPTKVGSHMFGKTCGIELTNQHNESEVS